MATEGTLVRLPGAVRCQCYESAKQDPDWRPGHGIDQRLRRFKCPHGHETYVTTWLENNSQGPRQSSRYG